MASGSLCSLVVGSEWARFVSHISARKSISLPTTFPAAKSQEIIDDQSCAWTNFSVRFVLISERGSYVDEIFSPLRTRPLHIRLESILRLERKSIKTLSLESGYYIIVQSYLAKNVVG